MTNHEAVFTKDTNNKKMTVVRTFNAPLQQVWDSWTQSEILDQWWAPKPWKAVTKSMDFREGGQWFYYMEGPEGERHYCKFTYKEIEPNNYYSGSDNFCDENGNVNTDFASMYWKVQFAGDGAATMVTVEINVDKAEDLETILKMGFKEGFTMGLNNLDEVLANS